MTRKDFEEYKYLNKRIKQTDEAISRLKNQLQNAAKSSDIVKGSSSEFPYTETRYHISGYNGSEAANIRRLIRTRQAYKQKLENLKNEIEEYISSIEDMKVQYIMTERFINGRRITDIAAKINYSQGRISQLIAGELKRLNNKPQD